MIFSASYAQASDVFNQSTYFMMRQLRWLVLGTVVLVIVAAVDYRQLQRISLPIMLVTVLLLLAVLVFGDENLGARRHLFGPSIQPSEIAKLTVTIYIAYWLTSKGERLRNVSYGLAPFAVLMGLVAGLIILQPDFGTTFLVVFTGLVMFFVAGADGKQLLISIAIAGLTLYLAITRTAYASQRVQDYLATLTDPTTGSYQVRASLEALARGGLVGAGLGDGVSKFLGGVPLPWSDSIFAVVGEELGLVGTLTVVALFMALAYRGLSIALKTKDQFGFVLACGITAWLVVQAFVNMAVTTATLPFSGLTLPFISYGGSSLLASMAGVGVLLSISRHGSRQLAPDQQARQPIPTGIAAPRIRGWNWWSRLSNLGRARRPAAARGRASAVAGSASRGSSSGYTVRASSTRAPKGLQRRLARTKRTLSRKVGGRRSQGSRSRGTAGRYVPRRR